ncbi:MAG: hypothetical protein AAGC60_15050 [Acidobacteriota bacterium]
MPTVSPRARFIVLVCLLLVAACGEREEAAELSFLLDRDRWSSGTVAAGLDTRVEADGTVEHTFRLVASDLATGEQVTFWGLAAGELVGTHSVRVFGRLAGFGGVAPRPITNACSSNDPSIASGTLSIENHDTEDRRLTGSFIANVCAVGEPDTTATLGDGRFVAVEY